MISIIIPTHNRLKMLKRAIYSVENQTFKNYEIIIISDGSTDGTNDYLCSIKNEKIKFHINESSKGASGARNIGLEHAKGDYIAFLDDDDEWFENHLELLFKKLSNSNDKVGLVYGWIDYYENNKLIKSKHPKLSGNIFIEMLDKQAITNSSVLMIKKHVLKKVIGFNEKLLRGNDGDFIRRISKFYHVDFVPTVLCKVHVGHDDRITLNTPKNLKNEIDSYLKRLEFFEKDFEKYKLQKSNINFKISISYLKLGNILYSLKFLSIAVKLTEFKIISFLHLKTYAKHVLIKLFSWN